MAKTNLDGYLNILQYCPGLTGASRKPRRPAPEMKCFKHQTAEAVAVCAYCGRALCPDCIQSPSAVRVVCSNDCAAALVREAEVFSQLSSVSRQLLHKSLQSLRANAFYCYLCGGLSAGAAVAAWFVLPLPFLIYFAAACAVVFILCGLWYSRYARNRPQV